MLGARGPLVFANIGRKPNFITLCVSFFLRLLCISYETVVGLLDLATGV